MGAAVVMDALHWIAASAFGRHAALAAKA